MNYQEQAQKFLDKAGATFSAEFVVHDFFFDDDKTKRDIYRITIERKGKTWSFRFGQSVHNSFFDPSKCPNKKCHFAYFHSKECPNRKRTKPTAYDVLACVTKSDPGSIDYFSSEYGFDGEKPSRIIRAHASVVEEWENVRRMFGDVMDELQEIA